MLVAFALHGQISQPAVGVNDAARFYRVLHKGHQACCRSVYNLAHPNPTDPGSIFLSGNDNQCFIQIEPAGQALLQTADVAFIHFHSAREQITSRSYHRMAQFAMYDGCRLATDVHFPAAGVGPVRLPTILSRTAYGRAGATACLPAIARELTARGFAMVAQDIRGRYGSEGVAEPFGGETADAAATLDWIVAQPWSDGQVVMIGDSYGGWLQWAAAASRHGALRAIVPGMTSARVADVWMYDGGVFNLSMMAQWAITGWSGRENVVEMPDWTVRPLAGLLDRWFPEATGNPFLRWATHGPSHPYWRSGAFAGIGAANVGVPALHLGGWWDLFRAGQLSDYVAAVANNDRQYLLMLAADHHHSSVGAKSLDDANDGRTTPPSPNVTCNWWNRTFWRSCHRPGGSLHRVPLRWSLTRARMYQARGRRPGGAGQSLSG